MKWPTHTQLKKPEPTITPERANEYRKYVEAYRIDNYRMHGSRLENAQADIAGLPVCGSLLDVGCGRGELLEYARERGFLPVHGTETVPALVDGVTVVHAEGHALPFADKSFDVVICNDVIEHVLPGDDELLCKELARVARSHILITANNAPSKDHIGEELHINKRPYKEWDGLFREWFGENQVADITNFDSTEKETIAAPLCKVTWIPTNHTHETERWRIDL